MKTPIVMLMALVMLSACETFQGFGRDLQKGGNNIESVAKSVTP